MYPPFPAGTFESMIFWLPVLGGICFLVSLDPVSEPTESGKKKKKLTWLPEKDWTTKIDLTWLPLDFNKINWFPKKSHPRRRNPSLKLSSIVSWKSMGTGRCLTSFFWGANGVFSEAFWLVSGGCSPKWWFYPRQSLIQNPQQMQVSFFFGILCPLTTPFYSDDFPMPLGFGARRSLLQLDFFL